MVDCLVANWIFYACMFLAAALSLIPIVGKFLNVLNTLIHESGHAIMSLLTGGGVVNIKLSADTSGAAQTKSKYWIGKFLTSLAGYPVSSAVAWLFFWLINQQQTNYVFYIIVSLVFINLILWVRNTFGMIWLVVMGSIYVLIYLYTSLTIQSYFTTFCAGIILFQSVYSSFTLLIISVKQPTKAGDAKNLKEFTFIPALFWASAFCAFAVYVTYKVFKLWPCFA
jgi:hypothetical protein